MEGRHVLLVDDDVRAARVLARMLTEDGLEVAVADGGTQALDHLEDDLPDVLVTDLKMPSPDGLTVARQARARRADLPVLVVTGYPDLASGLRGLDPPAQVFVKPIDYAVLRRAIEDAAGSGR